MDSAHSAPTQTHVNGICTNNSEFVKGTPERTHSFKLPSISSEKTKSATKKLRGVVNKETLPLKVTLFLFYGGMAALLPYLTIHMQDIGISIKEVAVIYAILPFTTFIGPPVMGFLADRWGQYKPVCILVTIGCGVFHTMLLFVPQHHVITTPGNTFLQWDLATNQMLLLPDSETVCEAFIMHHSQFNNFTLQSINKCQQGMSGGGSLKNREFHQYKYVEKGEDVGLFQLIKDLNDDEEENGQLHLKIELRGNCSIQVSSRRYLRSNSSLIGHNVTSVRCRTNLDFDSGVRQVIGDETTTFWMYFIIRIVATIFMSSCFTLLDATTLAVVKKSGTTEYGKERIWSILGLAVTSPIAGILVDQVSHQQNYTDYSPAFYLSNFLLILNIMAYFFMDLQVEKPENGVLKNGYKLLRYPEVVVFLVMIFIMGSLWGFVESYLFIFLKELDAPNYLLGLTLTIGSLTGLPFLWGAEKIVSRIGRVNLLIIAFLTYFIRYFGYSYITNPFWCFPFEAMEAITYHLMWTAAATYCSILAPKGLLATLTGIMGSLHYSLGKGNGSFIGGYLFGEIGARLTFRWFGVAAGVFGICFFFVDFLWIRKVIAKRLENESEPNKKGAESDKDFNPIVDQIKCSNAEGESDETVEVMLTDSLSKETSHSLY